MLKEKSKFQEIKNKMGLTLSEILAITIIGGITAGIILPTNTRKENIKQETPAQVAPSNPAAYTENTQPIAHVPLEENYNLTSVTGDFDGDGDLDLIIGSGSDRKGHDRDNAQFCILENLGGGNLAEPRPIIYSEYSPNYDITLVAGDMDNDGDLDLIIGSGVDRSGEGVPNGAIYLFKNDGKGNFRPLTQEELIQNMMHRYTSESMLQMYDEDENGELNGKEFTKFMADQKKIFDRGNK